MLPSRAKLQEILKRVHMMLSCSESAQKVYTDFIKKRLHISRHRALNGFYKV